MKTLIKWIVKKYVSKDALKKAVHSANHSLREKVQAEGKEGVIDKCNDAAEVTGTYLSVYADDGKITDDAEEAKVNDVCDKMIDKYIGDDLIDTLLEKVLG